MPKLATMNFIVEGKCRRQPSTDQNRDQWKGIDWIISDKNTDVKGKKLKEILQIGRSFWDDKCFPLQQGSP